MRADAADNGNGPYVKSLSVI